MPRHLDPRNLPADLPPEIVAFIRGPIDGRDDWLDAFLEEPELDNLRTFRTADDLTPQEARRVRDIVATGTPRQARFNLLLNSQLVPEDIRLDALEAALEDADPYMRIAAAVGLQDPSNTPITPASWPPTRDALIARLDDAEPAIRNRASVTLAGRAASGDGPALLAAQIHDDETGNMLIAAIRAGADDVVVALLPRMVARPMPDETRAYLERWQAAGRRPTEDPPPFLMLPALGYIPNFAGG